METETDWIGLRQLEAFQVSRFREAVNTVLAKLKDVKGIKFATIINVFLLHVDVDCTALITHLMELRP